MRTLLLLLLCSLHLLPVEAQWYKTLFRPGLTVPHINVYCNHTRVTKTSRLSVETCIGACFSMVEECRKGHGTTNAVKSYGGVTVLKSCYNTYKKYEHDCVFGDSWNVSEKLNVESGVIRVKGNVNTKITFSTMAKLPFLYVQAIDELNGEKFVNVVVKYTHYNTFTFVIEDDDHNPGEYTVTWVAIDDVWTLKAFASYHVHMYRRYVYNGTVTSTQCSLKTALSPNLVTFMQEQTEYLKATATITKADNNVSFKTYVNPRKQEYSPQVTRGVPLGFLIVDMDYFKDGKTLLFGDTPISFIRPKYRGEELVIHLKSREKPLLFYTTFVHFQQSAGVVTACKWVDLGPEGSEFSCKYDKKTTTSSSGSAPNVVFMAVHNIKRGTEKDLIIYQYGKCAYAKHKTTRGMDDPWVTKVIKSVPQNDLPKKEKDIQCKKECVLARRMCNDDKACIKAHQGDDCVFDIAYIPTVNRHEEKVKHEFFDPLTLVAEELNGAICPGMYNVITKEEVEKNTNKWRDHAEEICRKVTDPDARKKIIAVIENYIALTFCDEVLKKGSAIKWHEFNSIRDKFIENGIVKSLKAILGDYIAYGICAKETEIAIFPFEDKIVKTEQPQDGTVSLDCIETEWGEWEGCGGSCIPESGTVLRRRVRSVLRPHVGEGRKCVTEEVVACTTKELPLCKDMCLLTPWSKWGTCTNSISARHRYVRTYSKNCDGVKLMERRRCNENASYEELLYDDDEYPSGIITDDEDVGEYYPGRSRFRYSEEYPENGYGEDESNDVYLGGSGYDDESYDINRDDERYWDSNWNFGDGEATFEDEDSILSSAAQGVQGMKSDATDNQMGGVDSGQDAESADGVEVNSSLLEENTEVKGVVADKQSVGEKAEEQDTNKEKEEKEEKEEDKDEEEDEEEGDEEGDEESAEEESDTAVKEESAENTLYVSRSKDRENCTVWSEWSGCSSVCRDTPGYQYRLSSSKEPKDVYDFCGLYEKRECEDLPDCGLEKKINCDSVRSVYYTEGSDEKCREECRSVVERCKRDNLQEFECVTRLKERAMESEDFFLKCTFDDEQDENIELMRTLFNNKCFLSKAVYSNDRQEWMDKDNKSCFCSIPGSVPCTAKDIHYNNGEIYYELIDSGFCPTFDYRDSFFVPGTEGGTADSRTYISLSGSKRMHCPLAVESSIFTYSDFNGEGELRDFCQHGPVYALEKGKSQLSERAFGHTYDCDTAVTKGSVSDIECKLNCRSVRVSCLSKHESYVKCIKDRLLLNNKYEAQMFTNYGCRLPPTLDISFNSDYYRLFVATFETEYIDKKACAVLANQAIMNCEAQELLINGESLYNCMAAMFGDIKITSADPMERLFKQVENQAKKFKQNCAFNPALKAGGGYVMCKFPKEVSNFEGWSGWSKCTADCNDFEGIAVRYRTRKIAEFAKNKVFLNGLGTLQFELCMDLEGCEKGRWIDSLREEDNTIHILDYKSFMQGRHSEKTEWLEQTFNRYPELHNEVKNDVQCQIFKSTKILSYKGVSCGCPKNHPPCSFPTAVSNAMWMEGMENFCSDHPLAYIGFEGKITKYTYYCNIGMLLTPKEYGGTPDCEYYDNNEYVACQSSGDDPITLRSKHFTVMGACLGLIFVIYSALRKLVMRRRRMAAKVDKED
ncbi:hypothetical protein BgAZ_206380 [Babesia gibsoni]|uniref:Uncharacterized protein n=1 Tax=Babesia gibsoni TaxID=33632 RepID=A0AAD8PEB3_BABGI|nr:hypothetical protein BgAZ_206380 [Babesia gibsoni]